MRILIVDDEEAVRKILCQICTREGHEVLQAGSAAEALVLLRVEALDLLITDVVMPELDGFALVRRAKSMQPDIMPIVITGHAGEYTLEDVLDAGASDLILKPFRAPELRARLKIASDQRRTMDQLKARGRAIQSVSSEMIDGLQKELDEARQQAARLAAVIARGDETV
jgi:DNA-binding response OmpR family regulator